MAHTSAPGMLRRNAVRNGMGLPPRRTYTATCVDSNNPQAVQIARITHQRGYDECARRPDGIMNRLSSLSTRNPKQVYRAQQPSVQRREPDRRYPVEWSRLERGCDERRGGTVKCDVHATNGAGQQAISDDGGNDRPHPDVTRTYLIEVEV